MAFYAINGTTLTSNELNGTAPTSHSVGQTPNSVVETIGGSIAVEGPSGARKTFTLYYDKRTTKAVRRLLDYLNLDNSPIVLLSLPDVQTEETGVVVQFTNIVCIAQRPDIKTDSSRQYVESFSISLTESYGQT